MSLWLVVLLYEWGNNLVVVVDDDVVWVIPFCYLPMSLLGNKPKFGKLMAINIFMGLVMILLASLSLESLMVLCLHNWQLLEFTQLPSMSCQCCPDYSTSHIQAFLFTYISSSLCGYFKVLCVMGVLQFCSLFCGYCKKILPIYLTWSHLLLESMIFVHLATTTFSSNFLFPIFYLLSL